MKVELLETPSIEELELLKADASEEIFKLQNNPETKSIDYWTEIFTTCKNLIKQKNG